MEKEELLKKIGARIRHIRTDKKMSQTFLANSIDKDQQSIQRLETGNINPSIFYLKQIAEGLGVKLEEIIKDL